MPLRATAAVNLAAIERNVATLRRRLAAGAELCAVVKADGYGHGASQAAGAALAGGATSLAVATADEAGELRAAGVEAPLLVMGAVSSQELEVALAADAQLVAWDPAFVEEVRRRASGSRPVRLHVKFDTGMGRLGTRDERQALDVAGLVAAGSPELELAGAMTHFATADDDLEFMERQLEKFEPFARELRMRWPDIALHAANSAATLRESRSHLTLVRCGIAIYGCDPMHRDPDVHDLEPALELRSYVAAVKRAQRGDSAGYGRRFTSPGETWIATVPIGYGDGIRRALTNNCDVLIGGRRHPLVGTVSMDNITVDLGPEPVARVGEPATIIGRDEAQRQTAEDLARRIDTINYEVLTGISRRVPRVYHRDGEAA
ncbi:MAG: alanine racemase [Solirubrobacteraceae bacterium]